MFDSSQRVKGITSKHAIVCLCITIVTSQTWSLRLSVLCVWRVSRHSNISNHVLKSKLSYTIKACTLIIFLLCKKFVNIRWEHTKEAWHSSVASDMIGINISSQEHAILLKQETDQTEHVKRKSKVPTVLFVRLGIIMNINKEIIMNVKIVVHASTLSCSINYYC